jgi:7,8-dihydro-6-hydroxymethylpterin-pyrophosphokinase
VERRLGRRPSRRYAERVIDVDLLLFGAEILETSDLVLPHPRLPERDFFLDLLAEVWPEALDPRNGEPWTRTHPAQRRWPRVAMLARP